MAVEKRSCIDCGIVHCKGGKGKYPPFCLTDNMEEAYFNDGMAIYDEDDNMKLMQTAESVERDGNSQWPRVYETAVFAKRMGYKRIGIATCARLIRESRTLASILRDHGFDVFGIVCKVGAVDKCDMGVDPQSPAAKKRSCNPIMQAKLLNDEKTDMNIIMGLCVGHDMLFTKYSNAPVTTLVAKDRVTAHNPVAPLYTVESYYSRIRKPLDEE